MIIQVPSKMECNCNDCKREIWKLKKDKSGKELVKPSGFWMPKTKNGSRMIPIAPKGRPILKEYFLKNNQIRDVIKNRIYAWRIVKRVAKRSGLERTIFPHCLRGTFATSLANKEFAAFDIQGIMGWKDIGVASAYINLAADRIKTNFDNKWKDDE